MILKDRWTRMDRGWRRRISKAPRIVAYNSSEFSWSKGDDDASVHHYLTCKVEIWSFPISASLRVATKKISVIQVFHQRQKKKTVPISLQKSPSKSILWPTTNNSQLITGRHLRAFQTASALPKKAAMCNGVRRCWSAWLRCSTDSVAANLGGKTAGNSWNLMIPWRALREWRNQAIHGYGDSFPPQRPARKKCSTLSHDSALRNFRAFFLVKTLEKRLTNPVQSLPSVDTLILAQIKWCRKCENRIIWN